MPFTVAYYYASCAKTTTPIMNIEKDLKGITTLALTDEQMLALYFLRMMRSIALLHNISIGTEN